MANVQATKFTALRRAIALGIDDLNSGRFKTYSESDSAEAAADIKRRGRRRLNAAKARQKK